MKVYTIIILAIQRVQQCRHAATLQTLVSVARLVRLDYLRYFFINILLVFLVKVKNLVYLFIKIQKYMTKYGHVILLNVLTGLIICFSNVFV